MIVRKKRGYAENLRFSSLSFPASLQGCGEVQSGGRKEKRGGYPRRYPFSRSKDGGEGEKREDGANASSGPLVTRVLKERQNRRGKGKKEIRGGGGVDRLHRPCVRNSVGWQGKERSEEGRTRPSA